MKSIWLCPWSSPRRVLIRHRPLICLTSTRLPDRRRWLATVAERLDRNLLTLAVETSCDDTCVAVLEKFASGAARLHFNEKITSDHRQFRGIHPYQAAQSHMEDLGDLIARARRALPPVHRDKGECSEDRQRIVYVDGEPRRMPDFVTCTRGPGMKSNLVTGLCQSKGLAIAWDVPFLGVNHMQAHALTPRLVDALELDKRLTTKTTTTVTTTTTPAQTQETEVVGKGKRRTRQPDFPFLSLLVSGGHTMVVHSRGLCDHQVLAETKDTALGNVIDHCAREILPDEVAAGAENVSFGPLLERFAFPSTPTGPTAVSSSSAADHSSNSRTEEIEQRRRDEDEQYGYTPPATRADEVAPFESGRGWRLGPPLAGSKELKLNYSGFKGEVLASMQALRAAAASSSSSSSAQQGQQQQQQQQQPSIEDRRLLARQMMRLAFEHVGKVLVRALRQLDAEAENAANGVSSDTSNTSNTSNTSSSSSSSSATTTHTQKKIQTVVVSGGVASNRYLMHVLRRMLDSRGFGGVEIVAPPIALCTDNAAMIAWTGIEMYEAGFRSALSVTARRRWGLDGEGADGGVLGARGWLRRRRRRDEDGDGDGDGDGDRGNGVGNEEQEEQEEEEEVGWYEEATPVSKGPSSEDKAANPGK